MAKKWVNGLVLPGEVWGEVFRPILAPIKFPEIFLRACTSPPLDIFLLKKMFVMKLDIDNYLHTYLIIEASYMST